MSDMTYRCCKLYSTSGEIRRTLKIDPTDFENCTTHSDLNFVKKCSQIFWNDPIFVLCDNLPCFITKRVFAEMLIRKKREDRNMKEKFLHQQMVLMITKNALCLNYNLDLGSLPLDSGIEMNSVKLQ